MHSLHVILVVFTAVTTGLALIQKVEDDDYKKLGMGPDNPAESRREIYNNNPTTYGQSVYYWVKSCGIAQKIKC